ncbi:MAG: hypothetical protein ACYCVH_08190 [Ignavibacteriaceae bacterium]
MKIIFLLIVSTVITSAVLGQKLNDLTSQKDESIDTSAVIPAAADSDSVNISQMVLAQIEAARKKEEQANTNPAPQIQVVVNNNQAKNSSNLIEELESKISIPEDVLMKVSILGSASFLSAVVILVRRRKNRRKQPANKNLKDNIKSLREEKVQIQGNSKLSSVRNRLAENTPAYNLTQEAVSSAAKRLNISKEEILLAQKLKRMR